VPFTLPVKCTDTDHTAAIPSDISKRQCPGYRSRATPLGPAIDIAGMDELNDALVRDSASGETPRRL